VVWLKGHCDNSTTMGRGGRETFLPPREAYREGSARVFQGAGLASIRPRFLFP
jgi:hypothetical protein